MAIFTGQTILVTGASGGIGEAISRALGDQGATVCLAGRNRQRLRAIAGGMSAQRTQCYLADLTVEKEVHSIARKVLADHQRVDALVHCAAVIVMGAIATASVENFDRQFHANVLGPFRLTQLLLPALIASQGQVVFTNSSAGLTAHAGVSQYAATKHALKAVADSLREECNSAGVRVCSLFLGATATPMQAGVRAQQKRAYEPDKLIQSNDVARIVAAVLALPRTAEVTDVVMRPTAKT
jgi:NADP-dependent 3-hydroxy acid dehydrogenase YdfG